MPDQQYKTCTKCGQTYPATAEYFYPQPKGKYGLNSWCKPCHKQRNRENSVPYRLQHYDEIRQKVRDKYAANPDHFRNQCRAFYWKNLEQQRARVKINKQRFANNIRNYERNYYRTHAESISAHRRAKYKRTENHRTRSRNRKARLKMAIGTHTADDIKQIYNNQSGYCYYCGCILASEYHVDHKIALAKGGSNSPENLAISCPKCNLQKGTKTPEQWKEIYL